MEMSVKKYILDEINSIEKIIKDIDLHKRKNRLTKLEVDVGTHNI